MRKPLAEQLDRGQGEAAPTILAQADAPPAPEPANTPPEAANMCIVTAEDATLSFPVVAKDADGDPLTVAASQPQSGRTEVGPDGTADLRRRRARAADLPVFRPGRARRRRQRECDGVRQSDRGRAGRRRSWRGIDPPDLPALARACASGIALDAVTLSGPEVQIQDPAPGQRFQVMAEPGQQVQLQSRDFVDATYLVVDDGLLIVTPDGNMVYVADFVQAAEGENPITLSVYEGPAVSGSAAAREPAADRRAGRRQRGRAPRAARRRAGSRRWRRLQPVRSGQHRHRARRARSAPADRARAAHPAGDLRERRDRCRRRPGQSAADADGDPGQIVPVGEITITPEFTSGRQFPQLTEGQALAPSQINGIDQGNFTLGPSADARITFVDELAQFQNSLGVYLIDPDGTIHDARMVFPQIEHADADPSQAAVRPGGGPLQPGDAVLLSDLYDPGRSAGGRPVRPVPMSPRAGR